MHMNYNITTNAEVLLTTLCIDKFLIVYKMASLPSHHPNLKLVGENVSASVAGVIYAATHFDILSVVEGT